MPQRARAKTIPGRHRCSKGFPVILVWIQIIDDKVTIEDAWILWGLDSMETREEIWRRVNPGAKFCEFEGCNRANGRAKRKTLKNMGLERIADTLQEKKQAGLSNPSSQKTGANLVFTPAKKNKVRDRTQTAASSARLTRVLAICFLNCAAGGKELASATAAAPAASAFASLIALPAMAASALVAR